jgi:hypothetical protein
MTHTTMLLCRLRAAIPDIPSEYHRTTIRLAIAEIEHQERVEAVRVTMYAPANACAHCGKPAETIACSVGGCPLGADL